jgi:nucleoside-diphosphate-sugar epimerase
MRVLLIGCGYVGLLLGPDLVKQGHEVFGLRWSTGAEAEFRSAGIKPRTGDITQAGRSSALNQDLARTHKPVSGYYWLGQAGHGGLSCAGTSTRNSEYVSV